jgi:hypothetical protein
MAGTKGKEFMNPCPKPKKAGKSLVAQCEQLWREIVLLRAGNKSEFSGKRADPANGVYLQAHHILHKPNRRLRYEIENGICTTEGEHYYGLHGGREEEYRRRIQAIRGMDIFDRLYLFKNQPAPDLMLTKIYLMEELRKLKNDLSA